MPAAVRQDIANIVVDAGDADDGLKILAAAQIDDLDIFDRVAASYAEIGKSAESIVFTDRALAAHDPRHPADHCMRMTRRAVLADPISRTPLIQDLAAYGAVAVCGRLYNELKCWHAKRCEPYLLSRGVKAD